MLKKILGISFKLILGLFIFYLVLGFIILPFGLKWGIQTQGTKILSHPVKVRSVSFNPFLLQLKISGLEILDQNQKNLLLGFNQFKVDASFLKLFKKEYLIESILLDGPKVNSVLLSDGKINLMDLVPQTSTKTKESSSADGKNDNLKDQKSSTQAQPLPVIILGPIDIKNGQIRFTDQTLTPNFSTTLSEITIKIRDLSTKADCAARINFSAQLDEKGKIENEVFIKPFVQPLEMETSFKLNNYALDVLTPYVGKYAGQKVQDGKLDLSLDYKIADNKLKAAHKVLIQKFGFGEKVQSKDALKLPFGLAVALLEDPKGQIKIFLPASGDMSKPDFDYFQLIGGIVKNFFIKLVTKPFTFLTSFIDSESGTDDLGYARFLPGQNELSQEEKEKIKILTNGLKERPKLSIEINGTYDLKEDWKAISTKVFNQEYESLKKESTKGEDWIYQELYERRYGIREMWTVVKKFKSKKGILDSVNLNAELKRQLIEGASPNKDALEKLASERAKGVYDYFIELGLPQERIKIGPSHSVESSMGYVQLEFSLTVFGETPNQSTP